jgi:hypothetical protein
MAEVRMQISGVDEDEIDRAVAETSDLSFEPRLGNEPLTALIIVGAALAGGKLILRLINEVRGGTIIDVTQTPIDVRRDRNLPYGFFTIIAKDGSVRVEGMDEPKDALERMLGGVLELATTATSESAKAAIGAALGSGANIETEPDAA